jgi:hypothetical protein
VKIPGLLFSSSYAVNCNLFVFVGDKSICFQQILVDWLSDGYIWGNFDVEGAISSSCECIYVKLSCLYHLCYFSTHNKHEAIYIYIYKNKIRKLILSAMYLYAHKHIHI